MEQINAKKQACLSTPEGIGDRTTVRGKLALLGWHSLREWALAHGYDRQLAAYTIKTWGNRTDRKPHGGLTRQVMRDLRETLSTGKTPEMHAAQQLAAGQSRG